MGDRELIADIITGKGKGYDLSLVKDGRELALLCADKILALGYTRQPEYEPVELEALGDEELKEVINAAYIKHGLNAILRVTDGHKAISQATIQHNQAKGQLYRVKE